MNPLKTWNQNFSDLVEKEFKIVGEAYSIVKTMIDQLISGAKTLLEDDRVFDVECKAELSKHVD